MSTPIDPNRPAGPDSPAPPAAPSLAQLRQAAELLRQQREANQAAATPVAAAPAVAVAPPPAPVKAEKKDNTVPRADAQATKAQASTGPAMDELRKQALARAKGNRSDSRLALGIGTELHEYTIEWVLGVGGFGITYLALDGNLETEVALKEYIPSDMVMRNPDGSLSPKDTDNALAFKTGLDKFLLECRTLANFKHNNVVRVTRFFQANATAYMVMEYEHGKTFREWMEEKGGANEQQMLKMFLPMLDGLDVVHQAGFLHRDIKPANIFVRDNESMVLLDFGAARHAIGNVSRSLTTIVTPGYAPFEQYHSHGRQGPWTDLYALAGVMYWVVSGGSKPSEAPARIKQDNMAKAAALGKGRYSEPFLQAIDWALTPDDSKRPQNVKAFRDALTRPVQAAMPAAQIAAAPLATPASLAATVPPTPQPRGPSTVPQGSVAAQVVRPHPQQIPPNDMTATQTERWWKFWKGK